MEIEKNTFVQEKDLFVSEIKQLKESLSEMQAALEEKEHLLEGIWQEDIKTTKIIQFYIYNNETKKKTCMTHFVCCANSIGCQCDFVFQFHWLLNKKMIKNDKMMFEREIRLESAVNE